MKSFNDWVATKWAGYKTKIYAVLTGLAGLIIAIDPFDVIDVRQYIEWKYAGYFMLGHALVTYWLRAVTNREPEKK